MSVTESYKTVRLETVSNMLQTVQMTKQKLHLNMEKDTKG